MTLGYKVLLTKALNKHQGGTALLWQPDHEAFEVEAVKIVTPNLITFQLVMGDKRYYVMGIYISPNDMEGGDDLWAAWEAFPENCTPLVMGNLNISVEQPGMNGWPPSSMCWMKPTLLTCPTNSHHGGAACRFF
jgi:hypothetical protein